MKIEAALQAVSQPQQGPKRPHELWSKFLLSGLDQGSGRILLAMALINKRGSPKAHRP